MVELAECEAVRDNRFTTRVTVGENVRGVEQLSMAQPADGAGVSVRGKNASAECGLVEALDGQSRNVTAPGIRDLNRPGVRNPEPAVVDRDLETEVAGIIADHEHRPGRRVVTLLHAEQVYERRSSLHREP